MTYDTWNSLKKSLSEKPRTYFNKGEIWFVSIGKNVGDEEDGKNENFERPVVITRKFNNNIFIGIPLTSQNKEGKFYQKLKSFNSVAILSQVRLFDAKRLLRRIGRLDNTELNVLKENIRKLI
ncbi:MAG: type II toxin-antitoxin system PemK/MazF family toxin [bacterium]